MTGYTLAVFSDSPDYIHRFLAYCREHDTFFDVIGFTDLQALNDHLKDCSIDILLLPRNINLTGTINISSEKIREIVHLGEQQDMQADPKAINMYQPMGSLLADLKDIASSLKKEGPRPSSDADIIGMYVLDGDGSPGDLAVLLSESPDRPGERILYIDFDRFSGFAARHSLTPAGTISDLIYWFRSAPDILAASLKNCCAVTGNIHYISPPVSGGDPDEVPPMQWGSFIRTLAEAGSFGRVFINLKSYCRDMINMFGTCREIYLFSNSYQTAVSGTLSPGEIGYRAAAFHDYFILNERPDILLKMEDAYKTAAVLADSFARSPKGSKKYRDKWKKTT